jgi:hypothetical protein
MIEQPIPGFPEYYARADGIILSRQGTCGPPRVLRQYVDQRGYAGVHLYHKQRRYFRHVHVLLLRSFVGPPSDDQQCCHVDGNPRNNQLANLQWGTPHMNAADRERHGRTARGMRNGRARLTDEQVAAIRQCATQGTVQRRLAEKFNVAPSTINDIVHYRKWTAKTGGVYERVPSEVA